MAKYLAVGQCNCDVIVDEHGNHSEVKIGGSGFFALTGIRIFTEDCALVSNFGTNFIEDFRSWFRANGVSDEYCSVISEQTPAHYSRYTTDGKYEGAVKVDVRSTAEWLGYMHPKASDLKAAISDETVGFSIYQDADAIQWKLLMEAAEKHDTKVMWEVNHRVRDPKLIEKIAPIPHMFSINYNEVEEIFGIPKQNEMDAIELLRGFTNELCFYRVGAKGSYAITKDGAWFCPAIDPTGKSVDPMGCGNCSIGAAMYAHSSGHTPAEVAVMANVASGYNAAQLGPVPVITPEIQQQALQIVKDSMSLVKAY